MKNLLPNKFLIALLRYKEDLPILLEQHWYRIPVGGSNVPIMIKDRSITHIAFYLSKKSFGVKRGKAIRYKAEVIGIEEVIRSELFPNESVQSKKLNKFYYKILLKNIIELQKPVLSLRRSRILFIGTTIEKWDKVLQMKHPVINHLFNDSPLEEMLFEEFEKKGIVSERQFCIDTKVKRNAFFLDFAIFCKQGKIDVECDGLTYHYTTLEQKVYDNSRNNKLNSKGWHVLRYSTTQLEENIDYCMSEITSTVNKLGGIESKHGSTTYRYIPNGNQQLRLFD